MYTVYSVQNNVSGRLLVGVTDDLKRVKREILCRLRGADERKISTLMIVDYVSFGESSFVWEVIGEFSGKEEARIMAWYCCIEEKQDRKDADSPFVWGWIGGLYNIKGFRMRNVSYEGKLLIEGLTGMELKDDGRFVVGWEVNRKSHLRSGEVRNLKDKTLYIDFRRKNWQRLIR